jgi:hypothetical protein
MFSLTCGSIPKIVILMMIMVVVEPMVIMGHECIWGTVGRVHGRERKKEEILRGERGGRDGRALHIYT